MRKKYLDVLIKYLIISLAISSFIEVYICNFRHFESYFFESEIRLTFITDDKTECTNVGCVTIGDDGDIEISNIDTVVNNVYLDISSDSELIVELNIYVSDDANEQYFKAGERTYLSNIERSKYIKINASNNIHNIKLVFDKDNKNDFNVNDIIINKMVPLDINMYRMLIIFLFVLLLLIINPKSIFYKIKLNDKGCKLFIIILGIVCSLCCYKMIKYNYYVNQEWSYGSNYSQYYNLAEALSEGHFYLNLDVSDKLKKLDNPYDTSVRNKELIKGEEWYADYAYYNGKYYSYFGILPCLSIYLPYYLITGNHISNARAAGIIVCFYIFSCIYFMYQLCKKYFSNISLIWYLILTFGLLILSSGLVYALSRPSFYYQVIVMGVSLAVLGVGFWIRSIRNEKLSKRFLMLGSLCVALTSMCRPQLLLSLFFAIPLFYDYIKRKKLLSSKSIKESICFILPFIIVATIVMYYNYARFGSVFDFGANYNLTSNDMTKRGFHFDRTFLGIFSYLFQPNRITAIFPFIENYNIKTNYIGKTISEVMRGGYLFTNIVCILGLLFYKFKNCITNKKLVNICLCCVLFSLIIIVVDTQMAGILSRYILDFGWLLSISTIIVITSIVKKYKNIHVNKVLITLIMITLIYNILLYFTEPTLLLLNESVYWKFYYMFMFWL